MGCKSAGVPSAHGPRPQPTAARGGAAAVILGALGAAGIVAFALVLEARLRGGVLGEAIAPIFGTKPTPRLGEPLGYWNAMGIAGVLAATVALAGAAHLRRRLARAVLTAGIPLIVATTYLTYSRGAVLGGAIAVVLLVAFAGQRLATLAHAGAAAAGSALATWAIANDAAVANATGAAEGRTVALIAAGCAISLVLGAGAARIRLEPQAEWRRLIRVSLLAAAVGLIAAGAIAAPSTWRSLSDKIQQPYRPITTVSDRYTDLGNQARLQLWRAAIDAWRAAPGGTGAGTFHITFDRVAPRGFVARDAHSLYLQRLTERGTAGLVLLLALIAAAGALLLAARVRALSTAAQGLAGGSLAALTALMLGSGIDWYWQIAEVRAIAYLLLAAGLVPLAASLRAREGGRLRTVAWAAPAAVLVLAGWQLRTPPAQAGVEASQAAVRAGELDEARQGADDAIRADGATGTTGLLQRALVEERAGALGAARRALRLATQRSPADWRLRIVLARVQAESGNPAAAYAQLVAARRGRPNGAFVFAPWVQPLAAPGQPRRCTGNTAVEQEHCERIPRADGSWELPGDDRIPGARVLPPTTLAALARDAASADPRIQERAQLLTRLLRARPPIPAPPVTPTPPIPVD